MRSALITGITGQDGSYLTEWLLRQGYVVHGTVRPNRPTGLGPQERLAEQASPYDQQLHLHPCDLNHCESLHDLLDKLKVNEIYHLAAQSHVGTSFKQPVLTYQSSVTATLSLLEAVRHLTPRPRVLHVSSSEIFGHADQYPLDENSRIHPLSPYGAAKAAATQLVQVYRQCYGLHACNAICFNHESPRRHPRFVTRKITRGVAAIRQGHADQLTLGNVDVVRDWGYAPEYVQGMWRILQRDQPEDFILATGRGHSVREFLQLAFAVVDLDYRKFVVSDPQLVRPQEPPRVVGDPSKAQRLLSWKTEVSLQDLVEIMVGHDLRESCR